jgi:hypothetical protein
MPGCARFLTDAAAIGNAAERTRSKLFSFPPTR